jgi:hypothetical protein
MKHSPDTDDRAGLPLDFWGDELLAALEHIAMMTNDGYAERHAREVVAAVKGGAA